MATENTVILDGVGVKRALTRIAHEVLERNKGVKDLVLVGIRTGGVHLAHELSLRLEEIEGEKLPVGAVDITLYRDDIKGHTEHLPVGNGTVPWKKVAEAFRDYEGRIVTESRSLEEGQRSVARLKKMMNI